MSDAIITVDPAIPWWAIALLFVTITSWLLWKEFGRKLRLRTLRLIAVVTMMLMLAGILLRPSTNISKSKSVVLLTPRYKTSQIDSLLVLRHDLRIVNTPDAIPYNNSDARLSYQEIADLGGDLEFVAGEGLPGYALDLLDKKTFTYLHGDFPEGVVKLSLPEKVNVNESGTISGVYRNQSGKHSIILMGPGGKEDSVSITNGGLTTFSLSFTPKQTGKLLYTMVIRDASGNNKEEKLPITIEESVTIRVLVMLSYPTFETTFLKNFIASKGNEVVLRSQLSRNNFSYEYINHPAIRFSILNKDLLEDFDILVTDRQSLDKLSAQESAVLNQSIQNGLGLLSLFDVAPKEKDQNNFFPFRSVSVKGDTTTLSTGSKKLTLPVLPFRVVKVEPLQPISMNTAGILSGYTLRSKGKIGFQLLQETYRLILAGDTLAYGNIWSPLLQRISRTKELSSSIDIKTPFPYYEDEPIHLALISNEDSPTLFADSIQVPLREDVQLDDVWQTKIWASRPGWHTLKIGDQSLEYFVSEAGGWHSLAIQNQMMQNQLVSQTEHKGASISTERRKINPFFFYAFFLLSAGFLWLAPKL